MSDEPDYKALFDILIRALASFDYWVSVNTTAPGVINMTLFKNVAGLVGGQMHTIAGTPEECVAQIAAIEAEKRLTATLAHLGGGGTGFVKVTW